MLKRTLAVMVVGALVLWAPSGRLGAAAQNQAPSAPEETPSQPSPSTPAPDTAAPEPTGGQPDQRSQPTFRAGINFVRVDVIVSDKTGKPVLDLKPEDFTVTEDGKPQDVESFKLVRVEETAHTTPARPIRSTHDEESEAQREDVRLFAIFLDDYHVRRGASMYVREPLMRFLRTQIAPSDLVTIMYPLTPLSDVIMSRDHESMARAIERFDGRKYDYVPRNQFEEQYANYPVEIVERVRNEVSLSALRSLVTHMGSLREGRKAVILVSEGYTYYVPPQMRDPMAQMPGFGNPQRRDGSAGTGMREDHARFRSDAEIASDLREVFDTANRNNTAIYSLDPRGLGSFEFDINESVGDVRVDSASLRMTQNSLMILADETDGRAIINQNDLAKGLRQIVQDTSTYYLLGYNSTEAPQDGKFHEIKVRVNRKGLQVRHRKGYWALTPQETARALAPPAPERPKELDLALATITGRPRGQQSPIRTWFGTSRGENGKTRVTFVWEPVPPTPGVKSESAAALTVTAVAPDGSPYFRGRVPESAAGSTNASAATNGGTAAGSTPRGPAKVVFEAPPGPMQLRYSVEGETSGVLDTDVREYTIPDLTAPQVQLSTPQVIRARSVKEFRDLNAAAEAVPTVGREFRRTDRLLIRFEAYGPAGMPKVAARLLNRTGQKMIDLPVGARTEGMAYQVDLPLAGMAAAEYVVEITASGEAGDAKQLIAFRVVG
jgi:VWFA-related protein